jgi:leucyl aminopeptidase (aminopeptidase T)
MSYLDIRKAENEEVWERLELSVERLFSMREEMGELPDVWRDYFTVTGDFLRYVWTVGKSVRDRSFFSYSLEKMQEINGKLYKDILGGHYEESFACPSYAVKRFCAEDNIVNGMQENNLIADGVHVPEVYVRYVRENKVYENEMIAKMSAFLYAECYGLIGCVFEQKLTEFAIFLELYLEIYGLVRMAREEGTCWLFQNMQETIQMFYEDYSAFFLERRTKEMLDPACDFAVDIIMNADLTDLRYLYFFGEYISDNQLKMAEFLNTFPQEEIDAMAETFVEGFRLGFVNGRIDMSGKRTVNIRYTLGFERIVRAEIEKFAGLQLKPTIYRKADFSIQKKMGAKIGYYGGSPCEQFYYDHRMDEGLYLDKQLADRKLAAQKKIFEKYKQQAKEYAGPACMEIFGEEPFMPKASEDVIRLDEYQQKLSVDYRTQLVMLQDQYIPGDEYSFTIIAYPVPEIGEKFEQIFQETVKVNTLPQDRYREIQQKMIDTLDLGSYVRVTGKNGNRTDMKIMLHTLDDPKTQTNFENCVADVNIPVGEVFTSPVLKGTKGTLHVSEVYLEGLRYENLELVFQDGMITDYRCENYNKKTDPDSTEEELAEKNKRYVHENILSQHETLPIGEFAIGTNTTAYRMGKEYQIFSMLPILIAEKTGPHFAVGDTCYSMSEDHAVYNPDGKEIIARENECSALRKTEKEKAYFNCHTDITIPYDELGKIAVYVAEDDGTEREIVIIEDGKFVLEGTEELNKALEE